MSNSQPQSPCKNVLGHRYFYVEASDFLPSDISEELVAAEKLARVTRMQHFNVARFENSTDLVSLLHYPRFFEEGFPALHESWRVDLATGHVSYRTYRESLTPPILHRKELMLPKDHPRRAEFQALTQAAEAIGLFDDSTRIGFREPWLHLVREKGYHIVGHELIPVANDESTVPSGEAPNNVSSVARHLTALVRQRFSAPIQALARYGL